MIKQLFAISAFLLTLPAEAVDFSVLGRGGVEIYRANELLPIPQSVGAMTMHFLEQAKREKGMDYRGTAEGISSIAGLPTELVEISEIETHAYGWCYSVNGFAPELMPDQAEIYDPEARIVWFYARSRFYIDDWVAQCEPAPAMSK
jgi:hypothetical protein